MSQQQLPTWPGLPKSIAIETDSRTTYATLMYEAGDLDGLPSANTVFVVYLKPARMTDHSAPGVRRMGVAHAYVWEIDPATFWSEGGPPDVA